LNFLTPNIDFYKNFYDKEKFLLAWRMSMLMTVLFFILSILHIINQSDAIITLTTTFVLALSSTIYLWFSKKFVIIFWIYSMGGALIANLGMNYVVTATHYVDFVWILTSILVAFIGISARVGIVLIVLNSISFAYFYGVTVTKLFENFQPKSNLGLLAEYVEMVVALIIVSYLMYKFSFFQNEKDKDLVVANKETAIKANENEVLIKEIHHRVKNNLQIIVSLLRLQQNEIKSEEIKHQFSNAINRVLTMSLIHQKLYQDNTLASIKIKDYLSELTADISKLSTLTIPIKVNINSDIESIGLKTIVPLGLIVNELMSNSLEHAFNDKNEALVDVSIKKKNNNIIELIYFDNGSWSKKSETYTTFGLELIEILTSQLDGEFKRDVSKSGTSFEFLLHNLDLENN
jgi:two-component sensor histidine kinase